MSTVPGFEGNQDRLLEYLEFCYERQSIWHKRFVEKLPAPWTLNTLMQERKFTNMYRELDRVTLYLLERVLHNSQLTAQQILFNTIVGRVFNTDKTFDLVFPLLDPSSYDWKFYEGALDNKLRKGLKLWGSAYTVCQVAYVPTYRKKDKHVQFLLVFDHVAQQCSTLTQQLQEAPRLKIAMQKITQLPLIGEFLAAEVVQDLCYSPGFFVHGLNDDSELLTVGPGVLQAVNYLYDRDVPLKQQWTTVQFLHQRQPELWALLEARTGKRWQDVAYKSPANGNPPWLSINNLESTLCEFRKYVNALHYGKGRLKHFTPQ